LPYIPNKFKIFSLNGHKNLNLPFTNLIVVYSLDDMRTKYRGKRCEMKSEERLEYQEISANLKAFEILFRKNSIKEMGLAKLNRG
jgi:hypothetical protein